MIGAWTTRTKLPPRKVAVRFIRQRFDPGNECRDFAGAWHGDTFHGTFTLDYGGSFTIEGTRDGEWSVRAVPVIPGRMTA